MTEISRRTFIGGMAAAFAATTLPPIALKSLATKTVIGDLSISKRPDFDFMTQFRLRVPIGDKLYEWATLSTEETIPKGMIQQCEEIFKKQFGVALVIGKIH